MEKDAVYSMRINRTVREVLGRAARKERRTVASLLDKIISEYLEQNGFIIPELTGKRRRCAREKISLPAKTILKRGVELKSFPCVIHDISFGGVMVSYPKGSRMRFSCEGKLPDFEICFELPRGETAVQFKCEVRYMRDNGNEIQVGAAFKSPNENDLLKLREIIQ